MYADEKEAQRGTFSQFGTYKASMEAQVGADIKLRFGSRKFYDIRIPSYQELANLGSEQDESAIKLFKYIDENCIGRDRIFDGPYGSLPGKT